MGEENTEAVLESLDSICKSKFQHHLIFENRVAEMLFRCWLRHSSSAIQLACVCGLVYYRAQTDHRAERGPMFGGLRGAEEAFCARDFAMRVGGTMLGLRGMRGLRGLQGV